MLWSRYAVGFHGCDAALAKKVVNHRADLEPSKNDYDWLGNGIYFWEGSYDRALDWAKANSNKSSSIKNPAVVGAVIDLGECLNLVESEYLGIVRQAYRDMKKLFDQAGHKMPENLGIHKSARKLDCAVFQYLHQSRKEQKLQSFDTIRAFFTEGEELYPAAGIRIKDHIQICVCNPAKILGYFLPAPPPR